MVLQEIYSGNDVPNFTRFARVLYEILQKTFWSYFFRTHCIFNTVTFRRLSPVQSIAWKDFVSKMISSVYSEKNNFDYSGCVISGQGFEFGLCL